MPKVTGVFDTFPDLDQIPIEDIAQWVKPTPPSFYIENYLANRLLYPQTVAVSAGDMNIDLAILREALKHAPKFFKAQEKKIVIPQSFLERFPPLSRLVWAFVDAYKPKDVVEVVVEKDGIEMTLGSILVPEFSNQKGRIELIIENQKFEVKMGSLTIIPCQVSHCHISFKSKDAKILGKNDLVFEGNGGSLGLMIDGRPR